jgi:hypothetical protein
VVDDCVPGVVDADEQQQQGRSAEQTPARVGQRSECIVANVAKLPELLPPEPDRQDNANAVTPQALAQAIRASRPPTQMTISTASRTALTRIILPYSMTSKTQRRIRSPLWMVGCEPASEKSCHVDAPCCSTVSVTRAWRRPSFDCLNFAARAVSPNEAAGRFGSETIRGGQNQGRSDGDADQDVIFFGHHGKCRA